MKKYDLTVSLTMIAQIILVMFVLVFGIMSMFEWQLFTICQILAGILMFVLAFNNKVVYKRKYMTVVYIIIGIIILARVLFG